MRSIWNGSIAFGLVNIPIKVFAATEPSTTGFRQICKNCMTPIKYERRCSGCEDPVKYEDIIKGLDLGNGQYLTFTKEELSKIKPEKSDRIEIREFVDQSEIKPIYYQKFYFLAPTRKKDRSFFLFKKVLQDSGKVAIGSFVMREKEYVCAVSAYESGMLLSALHYKQEIRDINNIAELEEEPELKEKELELAEKLVNQLYEKKLNIEQFKDSFAEKLQEMIEKKEKIIIEKPEEELAEVDEDSLMAQLQASLN